MYTKAIILAAATVAAASKFTVTNNCEFDSSVDLIFGGDNRPQGPVPAGKSFSGEIPLANNQTAHDGKFPLWTIPGDQSKGFSLLYAFVSHDDDGLVHYSMTEGEGHPFTGHKIEMVGSTKTCNVLTWDNGEPSEPQQPANAPGKCFEVDADVTLTLCAE